MIIILDSCHWLLRKKGTAQKNIRNRNKNHRMTYYFDKMYEIISLDTNTIYNDYIAF